MHRAASITFAGFRDGVSLGGHGLIRNDDTVVIGDTTFHYRIANGDTLTVSYRATPHKGGEKSGRSRRTDDTDNGEVRTGL